MTFTVMKMKTIILTSWLLCVAVYMVGQQPTFMAATSPNQTAGPSMTFDAPNIDIGKIKKGEKKEMTFHFTNTGTEVLKIEIVSGCECTTLDWPRTPIEPGAKGVINALFDSAQKEKSETVDIDINLENIDPKSGYPMFERVTYTFELVE